MPRKKSKKSAAKVVSSTSDAAGSSAAEIAAGSSAVEIAAGSSAMEVDAIVSHEELQTLETLGLNLENLETLGLEAIGFDPHKVVEVVYVESALKRTESVSSGKPLTQDWLRRCARDSYEEWHDHLEVQPDHLEARVVPESAVSASDVAIGKGLVIVELKEDHMEEGLVGQLALASGNALTLEGANRTLMDLNETLIRQLATERDIIRQEFAAELQSQRDVSRREHEDLRHHVQEQDIRIEVQSTKIEALGDQLQQLQAFAKEGLKLSNKVKKRVALALARTAVERAVGKVKVDNMSWSKYISELSPAQWSTVGWSKVGASKKPVKDLLANGAYDLNDSVHSIPPEEVVGSIAGMQYGPHRTAWEEIFFLAFQREVADEVFAEHFEYAAREKEMLGGEQPEV